MTFYIKFLIEKKKFGIFQLVCCGCNAVMTLMTSSPMEESNTFLSALSIFKARFGISHFIDHAVFYLITQLDHNILIAWNLNKPEMYTKFCA